MRRALLLASIMVACSSPPRPEPTTTARTRPVNETTTVAPAHDAPSEAECDALFAHALGITFAAQPATEADQAAVRAELRSGFIADCRAGTRAYHRCGVAAKTVAELDTCRSLNAE